MFLFVLYDLMGERGVDWLAPFLYSNPIFNPKTLQRKLNSELKTSTTNCRYEIAKRLLTSCLEQDNPFRNLTVPLFFHQAHQKRLFEGRSFFK